MKIHSYGNEHAPTIIMLPGSFCNADTMANIINVLSPQYHNLAADYNGQYAGSEKPFTSRRGEAEDLGELLVLRDISKALMRRIDGDYRMIITLNSMLILLGAFGIITPATSAMMHNLSTIGISLYNMTDLVEA